MVLMGAHLHASGFVESFDDNEMLHDPSAQAGWDWRTGAGEATMTFSQSGGIGIIDVDARADRRNIWWAMIRRGITADIDIRELARADRELRVEARVRTSAAPRRVNLHFNHSRTTDYHSHLKEFDIPEADIWHRISMTSQGFGAVPGDEVFVQLALMDWGYDRYQVEIDRLAVSLVNPQEVGPDLGEPLPYRPDILPPENYSHGLRASQDASVDSAWPQVNFSNWANESDGGHPLLAVGGGKIALLRWDFQSVIGLSPKAWGMLELTTDQVFRADTGLEEFGELRIVEILGGDPAWSREAVTWENFLTGGEADTVLNGQMLIDVEPVSKRGGKTRIAVSPPVLRRLLSGRTKGLAIMEQGSIYATFYSGTSGGSGGPTLYLNLE